MKLEEVKARLDISLYENFQILGDCQLIEKFIKFIKSKKLDIIFNVKRNIEINDNILEIISVSMLFIYDKDVSHKQIESYIESIAKYNIYIIDNTKLKLK
jgi:hypothetical protein